MVTWVSLFLTIELIVKPVVPTVLVQLSTRLATEVKVSFVKVTTMVGLTLPVARVDAVAMVPVDALLTVRVFIPYLPEPS